MNRQTLWVGMVAVTLMGILAPDVAAQGRGGNRGGGGGGLPQVRFDTGQRPSPPGPVLGQSVPGIPTGHSPSMIGPRPHLGEGGGSMPPAQGRIPGQGGMPNVTFPNVPTFPRTGFPSAPSGPGNWAPANPGVANYPSYNPGVSPAPTYSPGVPGNSLPASPQAGIRPPGNQLPPANQVPPATAQVRRNRAQLAVAPAQRGQFGAFLTDPADAQAQADKSADETTVATQAIEAQVADAGDRQKIDDALKKFQDAVKNGAPADEVQKAKDGLNQAIADAKDKGAPITLSDQLKVIGPANQATQAAKVRDTILAMQTGSLSLPTGAVDFPTGTVAIVTVPGLPADQVLAVTPDVFLVGTGGSGSWAVTAGTAADLGLPVVAGEPVPEAAADAAAGVRLRNPAENRGAVTYLANGQSFRLEPGYVQELPAGQAWTVEFDRGNGQGAERYQLTEGTYKFKVTPEGWDLFAQRCDVVVDNTANAYPFHFLLGDEVRTVPARQKLSLELKAPTVAAFDAGDGGEPVRKLLEEGTYKVGVNPRSRKLDLYRPQEAPAAGRPTPSAPGLIGD